MNNFKILVCDDSDHEINLISGYMTNLQLSHPDINIEWKGYSFEDTFLKLKDSFDFLILDMYQSQKKGGVHKKAGEEILNYIDNIKLNIPTLLYSGAGHLLDTDYYELMSKYNFIVDFVIKGEKGRELKSKIDKYLFKLKESVYELCDDDDIFLHNDVLLVGEHNLNDILLQIKKEFPIIGKFVLHRMSSGLSGAVIFKTTIGNSSVILKVSKEKDKLSDEYDKSIKYYSQFPSRFLNHIYINKYSNHDVYAIVINEVLDPLTLFKWVPQNNTSQIENLLNELFLSKHSLKEHYLLRRSTNKEKFEYIFRKLNISKFVRIDKVINDLSPLFNASDYEGIKTDLRNFIMLNKYKNIDVNTLLGEKYNKNLVLCHGDFHANNILIQDGRPVIIDSGELGYNYWCLDVCRLIVHIFIVGLDSGSRDYYDINCIDANLNNIKLLLNAEKLVSNNQNEGYIFSLNWLVENVKEIYGDLFSEWEFCLGLMKEFLQMSYRVENVPPNKRTIALLASYLCLLRANSLVSK